MPLLLPPLTKTIQEFPGISINLGHLPEFNLSRSPEERDTYIESEEVAIESQIRLCPWQQTQWILSVTGTRESVRRFHIFITNLCFAILCKDKHFFTISQPDRLNYHVK